MRVNEVYEGDCLEVMGQLPDNCIDAIITDPPYSLSSIKERFSKTSINDANKTGYAAKNGTTPHARLSAGFMGKEWDNEIAFNPTVWREALRVAKPGAYLLAFGGTRTYHRLACAIEDAGWEIRDCITYLNDGNQAEAAFMASLNDEQLAAYLELYYPAEQIAWVYGQGMGLGYDVSKGIDKSKGADREVVGYDEIARGKFAAERRNGVSNINKHNREKAGEFYKTKASAGFANPDEVGKITAPATPLAAKFSGYRSRLKPAFEPIVVAMKPIDTNYAHNAERWGLAGLNIDGSRVPTLVEGYCTNGKANDIYGDLSYNAGQHWEGSNLGRYPANLTHSGESGVMAEFAKAGVRVSGARRGGEGYKLGIYEGQKGAWGLKNNYPCEGSKGSAARYFAVCPPDLPRFIYQAKAGPKERGAANNHPTVKPLSLIRELVKLTRPPDGGVILDPFAGSGTTALACISEGEDCKYILIEKEPEYCDIIRRRIAEYNGEEIAPKEIELNQKETVRQMSLW